MLCTQPKSKGMIKSMNTMMMMRKNQMICRVRKLPFTAINDIQSILRTAYDAHHYHHHHRSSSELCSCDAINHIDALCCHCTALNSPTRAFISTHLQRSLAERRHVTQAHATTTTQAVTSHITHICTACWPGHRRRTWKMPARVWKGVAIDLKSATVRKWISSRRNRKC